LEKTNTNDVTSADFASSPIKMSVRDLDLTIKTKDSIRDIPLGIETGTGTSAKDLNSPTQESYVMSD
jgi:hypothetical protein